LTTWRRVGTHDETIADSIPAIREPASPAAPKPKRPTGFVIIRQAASAKFNPGFSHQEGKKQQVQYPKLPRPSG